MNNAVKKRKYRKVRDTGDEMKQKKRKNSKQFNQKFRKRFFTKKSVTVLICAVIILVAIAFGCQSQRRKAEGYQETIEELSTEIRELKDTNKTLEEEKENMDSTEFMEKMARERLGMIGEDEYSLQQSENGETSDTTKVAPESTTEDTSEDTE